MWRWPVPALMLVAAVGCSGADSGPVFTADEVRSPAPPPGTQLVVPLTTVAPAEPASGAIVFDQLWSPEAGVAEISGMGAVSTDTITVDGVNSAFLSFENTADGGFIAAVSILGERDHIICIADMCGVLGLPD